MRAPKTVPFWTAATALLVADFATKRVAERLLVLHEPERIIGDVIRFTLTYNTGAALNLTLGSASRVAFSLLAVVMVVVLYRMYRAAPGTDVAQAVALGLVAGGAVGNLADRVRSARGVVDFIDLGAAGWRFWTFNVADIGVVTGALLLAALTFRAATSSAQSGVPSGAPSRARIHARAHSGAPVGAPSAEPQGPSAPSSDGRADRVT